MITEQDLQAAIAECEGIRNPNANTCLKLAAFYTIKDKLYPEEQNHFADASKMMYSGASEPEKVKPMLKSDTEFARAAEGVSTEHLFAVMDELMTTIQVLQPRLYDGVMRKLTSEY